MRIGIFDHFGWAIAVTVSDEYEVVDRRRVELVEPGITPAPFHYESRHLNVPETAALVARVRDSISRTARETFEGLAAGLPAPVTTLALRAWPENFPTDIEVLRRVPWESRADGVMYRQVLAEVAAGLGWRVSLYNPKEVVGQAAAMLGKRADVLRGPGDPPWTNEHRVALAAAILGE